MFDFPEFDLPSLKERVHWHYVNDASSFCDAYLLERSWIRGFEDLMCWAGHRIHFLFEIDQYIRDPILPKKIDNPK
jgi:hypothetical protein